MTFDADYVNHKKKTQSIRAIACLRRRAYSVTVEMIQTSDGFSERDVGSEKVCSSVNLMLYNRNSLPALMMLHGW